MHELALTESIVTSVSEHVAGAKVIRVVLEIGKRSGVVPDAVRFCFDVCALGTVLEGASLEVIEIPARAQCRDCQTEFELDDIIALCDCGSANLVFLSGEELRVTEVEVV
jgi:hydrogenase nickel incorporation protein HypA/HybF